MICKKKLNIFIAYVIATTQDPCIYWLKPFYNKVLIQEFELLVIFKFSEKNESMKLSLFSCWTFSL